MTTMTVYKIHGSSLDELFEELNKAISGKEDNRLHPKKEELLGLERKPHERIRTIDPEAAANGKPVVRRVENILLTIRDDLLEARKHLLHGATRRDTLRDLDYTVDQIDNLLAEM